MDYVNLGSTGTKVSRICLGTMTYGSKQWRQWVLEEEESLSFLPPRSGGWRQLLRYRRHVFRGPQ